MNLVHQRFRYVLSSKESESSIAHDVPPKKYVLFDLRMLSSSVCLYTLRLYTAAHVYGVGAKLSCRRGVTWVQPAGQKIRPVQRRSQRPVEGLSRAAGSMVQQDEICRTLACVLYILRRADGKGSGDRRRYSPAQLPDIAFVLCAVELHHLDDTLPYQRRNVVYRLVDEYAYSRDVLPQDFPQLRRLPVRHAAAAAGKDKADVIRMQFIGPLDIAAPRQAA